MAALQTFTFTALCVLSVLAQVTPIRVIGTEYETPYGLTPAEKQDLIDAHNAFRVLVARGEAPGQPPASDMVAMEWDDRLERDAQDWANTCNAAHNHAEQRRQKPYPNVGQNFAGNIGALRSVKVWYDELQDFDYYTDSCTPNAVCGHYTQVAWALSVKLGCGYKTCGDITVLFCHYAEGQHNGMTDRAPPKPYKEGHPCTACPKGHGFCLEGALCASRAACDMSQSECNCPLDAPSCRNGYFDGENCECVCGEGWEGMRCDEPCKDALDWCDQSLDNGYCRWDSDAWIWMMYDCKETCGLCVPKKDPGASNMGRIATTINMDILDEMEDKPLTTTPYTGPCDDAEQRYCGPWKDRGYCEYNPDWMQEKCRRTCGFC